MLCYRYSTQGYRTIKDVISAVFQDGFTCKCASGFEGRLCSRDIDECVVSPCEHGAECVNTIGSFSCICPNGFRGNFRHCCLIRGHIERRLQEDVLATNSEFRSFNDFRILCKCLNFAM